MLIEPLKKCEISLFALEKKYRIVLPEDYKEFLLKYNGFISKDTTAIAVQGLSGEIEIDSLFGVSVDKQWLSIEYWTDFYRNDLPKESLVIGYDLLRGMLVFILSGDAHGLYYWDCTMNWPGSTTTSNAYFICKTFTEFIHKISGLDSCK